MLLFLFFILGRDYEVIHYDFLLEVISILNLHRMSCL